MAAQGKPCDTNVYGTDKYNRLMNYYGQSCKDTEKATLSSMREVETANMFYYTEGKMAGYDNNKLGELRPNQIISNIRSRCDCWCC